MRAFTSSTTGPCSATTKSTPTCPHKPGMAAATACARRSKLAVGVEHAVDRGAEEVELIVAHGDALFVAAQQLRGAVAAQQRQAALLARE